VAETSATLIPFKEEANNYLRDPSRYGVFKHRLETAHAAVEAATVGARRRVRMNDEDAGCGQRGW
jgi:hypothetical protein